MFNKLRIALAESETQEILKESLDSILLEEDFDSIIEDIVDVDIVRLIMEEMDIYDNDHILMEEAEDADFDEEHEIEDEEIEDEELEELMESVFEDF